jgi:lipopolysaccharide/colanic/teichoic acid biosynthesis glycosyltransferase
MKYTEIKRTVDILISSFGLVAVSPVMILTAIAVKLESEGPTIFKQERLGLNGKVFNMYKFRSMYLGSEKDGVYETKGDKRVTISGKIIRKTSIDELPQFINIIKGDMSLIGPRPVLTYHPWSLEEYSSEQLKRFRVRPGVTGWAQINGRKDVEWGKRIEYDVEYVDKQSFKFDIKILLKTIIKVFTMRDNVNIGETASRR